MEEVKPKSFYEYGDYRQLLKDLFVENKLKNKKFSHRFLAKQAGFVAPNFIKLVMDGKSNLSEESIEKVGKAFKFNRDEMHFFKHLVLLNQAASSEERQIHAQEILRSKGYKKIHPLNEAQYNFYSNWYFVPVRELVGFPGFVEDPEWIANSITPAITAAQAMKALEELQKLGLLDRNPEGKLIQSNKNLATLDEVTSTYIAQWHREMMKKASESIDLFSREKRDISSVTLGMSKESINKVKELTQKFRKELVELVAGDASCDAVYQLNLHLFPLAEVSKKDGHDKKN